MAHKAKQNSPTLFSRSALCAGPRYKQTARKQLSGGRVRTKTKVYQVQRVTLETSGEYETVLIIIPNLCVLKLKTSKNNALFKRDRCKVKV